MRENHPKFDVVLFDLGSTLIYFNGSWPEAVATQHEKLVEYLISCGYRLEKDSFSSQFLKRLTDYYVERDTEFIEQSTEYILRTLLAENGYSDASSEDLRPALDAMYSVTQSIWSLEEDTLPTLDRLKASGYRLGLISNANDDQDVETLIDINGLRPYFEIVLISAAVRYRKPHPAIFKIALDHFQTQPARMVMVGDTLGADVLGAKNSGLASVWITRRADTPDNRSHEDTIQPDAVIATLAELPDLLAAWPHNHHHNQ